MKSSPSSPRACAGKELSDETFVFRSPVVEALSSEHDDCAILHGDVLMPLRLVRAHTYCGYMLAVLMPLPLVLPRTCFA